MSNPFLTNYLYKIVKEQEKDGRLSLVQNTVDFPLSTGQLSLDYFYKGGILPRFYTFAGPEQSGKSLCATTILASAYKNGIDTLIYFDAEETLNNETVETLFNVDSMETLISSRKEGKVEIFPKLHIFKGNSLEGVMDAITAIIDNLPEKVYIDDEKTWFYKFKKGDKKGKALMDVLNLNADEKVTKKYGCDQFILCKDPKSKPNTSGLQAIIIIDSLAMLLADTEKEDGPTQQMALEARRFAKHLKRFVGNLNKKQVAVIATNHVRENPNTMFGSKDYEPGGSAIKFSASVQTRIASISSSTAGWGGTGAVYEEDSILGETFKDKYQFKRFKLIKDKVGGGVSKVILQRVWIEDAFGQSWGYDPVLDTFEFLKITNQIEENRGRYTLKIPGFDSKTMTFKQFKKLVLTSAINDSRYKMSEEQFKEEFGIDFYFDIRQYCFNQISNGEIFLNNQVNQQEENKNISNLSETFDPETGEVRIIPVDQI